MSDPAVIEANRLIGERLYQTAAEVLLEALAQAPEDVTRLRALARVRMLQKRPAEAVLLLHQALCMLQNNGRSPEGVQDEGRLTGAESVAQDAEPHTGRLVPNLEIPDFLVATQGELDFEYAARVENEILASRDLDPELAEVADPAKLAVSGPAAGAERLNVPSIEVEPVDLDDALSDADSGNENAQSAREFYQDREEDAEGSVNVAALVDYFDATTDDAQFSDDDPVEPDKKEVAREYDPSLDDFGAYQEGEVPTRDELKQAPSHITRAQRARQIAQRLGDQYGWDHAGVQLLTSIFIKHWWSSTQSAMRRLLEAGITIKELTLADQIREVWLSYQEFSGYIDYSGTMTHRYRTLPWATSFDLVKAYHAYPDAAEIEGYLTDAYQTWSARERLQTRFPAFYDFLRDILDHHADGDMLPSSTIYLPMHG